MYNVFKRFPKLDNSITLKNCFKITQEIVSGYGNVRLQVFLLWGLPRKFDNWKPESVDASGKQNQIKPTLPTSSYRAHTLLSN